ncbi:MAG: N-formylmethionyl-tRNA deformylase [Anaerocolumna sp.]|jgi:peptide deformylase|nr:N-formylmethionyl-tRNA deformylase [Anaerocolumna sp.]
MIKDILLLGNSKLYEISEPVDESEITRLKDVINDLHDTLIEYRRVHGAGRAIVAPQIGVRDLEWNECKMEVTGDISELL